MIVPSIPTTAVTFALCTTLLPTAYSTTCTEGDATMSASSLCTPPAVITVLFCHSSYAFTTPTSTADCNRNPPSLQLTSTRHRACFISCAAHPLFCCSRPAQDVSIDKHSKREPNPPIQKTVKEIWKTGPSNDHAWTVTCSKRLAFKNQMDVVEAYLPGSLH